MIRHAFPTVSQTGAVFLLRVPSRVKWTILLSGTLWVLICLVQSCRETVSYSINISVRFPRLQTLPPTKLSFWHCRSVCIYSRHIVQISIIIQTVAIQSVMQICRKQNKIATPMYVKTCCVYGPRFSKEPCTQF